jgi:hypothetical protein
MVKVDRGFPLVEVLDEHDVAAVVVEFRIENIAAVWGDRQSKESTAAANLEYRAYFPGGEIEVVKCQDIFATASLRRAPESPQVAFKQQSYGHDLSIWRPTRSYGVARVGHLNRCYLTSGRIEHSHSIEPRIVWRNGDQHLPIFSDSARAICVPTPLTCLSSSTCG